MLLRDCLQSPQADSQLIKFCWIGMNHTSINSTTPAPPSKCRHRASPHSPKTVINFVYPQEFGLRRQRRPFQTKNSRKTSPINRFALQLKLNRRPPRLIYPFPVRAQNLRKGKQMHCCLPAERSIFIMKPISSWKAKQISPKLGSDNRLYSVFFQPLEPKFSLRNQPLQCSKSPEIWFLPPRQGLDLRSRDDLPPRNSGTLGEGKKKINSALDFREIELHSLHFCFLCYLPGVGQNPRRVLIWVIDLGEEEPRQTLAGRGEIATTHAIFPCSEGKVDLC